MSYAIVNDIGKNKFYLCGLNRGYAAEWENDSFGRIVRKVERIPKKETRKEKGRLVTGCYLPDIDRAMKFRSEDAAWKKIMENPVLRFCRVEEVRM